jgi:hypothetical protein
MIAEKTMFAALIRAHWRFAVIALVAGVVSVGSPAAVQGQEASSRRLEDVMPPEYAARVREIAREAGEAGVPPGLIARKAFEGVAKGYPPERVVSALGAYSGRLREAKGLLGAEPRPASLAAAAEALRRGVPPDAIRSMAGRENGRRDLAVPLIVLSDLTEAGVPTENALEMVNSAMDRGARGDQMLGFSSAVRRQMRQGADWRTAVDEVQRRAGARSQQRDRQTRPDGVDSPRNPGRRPASATPIPPGTEPPHRQRDGG